MNQKADLKVTPWINKTDHRQVSFREEASFFSAEGTGGGEAFNLNGLTEVITRAGNLGAETKSWK